MPTVVSCITPPSVSGIYMQKVNKLFIYFWILSGESVPGVSNLTMDGNCQSIAIPMCQQMPVSFKLHQLILTLGYIVHLLNYDYWRTLVQRNSYAKLTGNETSRGSAYLTGTVPLLARYQLLALPGELEFSERTVWCFNLCFNLWLLDILSLCYLHTNLYLGTTVFLSCYSAVPSSVWASQVKLWTTRQKVISTSLTRYVLRLDWILLICCSTDFFRMGFVWPHSLDCHVFPDVIKGVCLTPEAILKQSKEIICVLYSLLWITHCV